MLIIIIKVLSVDSQKSNMIKGMCNLFISMILLILSNILYQNPLIS